RAKNPCTNPASRPEDTARIYERLPNCASLKVVDFHWLLLKVLVFFRTDFEVVPVTCLNASILNSSVHRLPLMAPPN
ncbi:MAG: hypothetical protein OEV26_04535, partial [Gallionella sp.]|nr:hypothetical protein [Gallionella sp.]